MGDAIAMAVKILLAAGYVAAIFSIARGFARNGYGPGDWGQRAWGYFGAFVVATSVAGFILAPSCGPDGADDCGTLIEMFTNARGHYRTDSIASVIVTMVAAAIGIELGLRNSKIR